MSIQLFKDGNRMSIQSDHLSSDGFLAEFASLLATMIDNGEYEGDWEYQLGKWLPQVVDISCACKGYKTNVEKRTIMIAGSRMPGQPCHDSTPFKQGGPAATFYDIAQSLSDEMCRIADAPKLCPICCKRDRDNSSHGFCSDGCLNKAEFTHFDQPSPVYELACIVADAFPSKSLPPDWKEIQDAERD